MLKCYRALEIYISGQVDTLNKIFKLTYTGYSFVKLRLLSIYCQLIMVVYCGVLTLLSYCMRVNFYALFCAGERVKGVLTFLPLDAL